jgi:hypothetical protein
MILAALHNVAEHLIDLIHYHSKLGWMPRYTSRSHRDSSIEELGAYRIALISDYAITYRLNYVLLRRHYQPHDRGQYTLPHG